MILWVAIALLAAGVPQDAALGDKPQDRMGARNLAAEYHLPPLKNHPGDPLYRSLTQVQVLARATRLSLSPASAVQAWAESAGIYQRGVALEAERVPAKETFFSGKRASALNRRMAQPGPCSLRVTTPVLLLDEPIYPGDHCRLNLQQTTLKTQGFQPYQLQIKGRRDVHVLGGRFTAGQWGISVTRSRDVVLTGLVMSGLQGGGVMVTNSVGVTLMHCRFTGLGGAALMLHGNTHHAVIADNEMLNDTGWSNWHAGIVITDRNQDPGDNATALLRLDGILVKQTKITDRLTIPHDNVIFRNVIAYNKTSGIYSDGGARNTFLQNTVQANAKEACVLTTAPPRIPSLLTSSAPTASAGACRIRI